MLWWLLIFIPPKPLTSLHTTTHSVPQAPQNKSMAGKAARVVSSPHGFSNPMTSSYCPVFCTDFTKLGLLSVLLSSCFLNPYLPPPPQLSSLIESPNISYLNILPAALLHSSLPSPFSSVTSVVPSKIQIGCTNLLPTLYPGSPLLAGKGAKFLVGHRSSSWADSHLPTPSLPTNPAARDLWFPERTLLPLTLRCLCGHPLTLLRSSQPSCKSELQHYLLQGSIPGPQAG